MEKTNTRAVGARYEEVTCAYLQKQGLVILERNFRGRQGEIDIIAKDGEYVVFVEVKYRTHAGSGNGEEAVTVSKQKTICRIADLYRAKCALKETTPLRFDVVALSPDERGEIEVSWYRNAFLYRR